ncbi:snurportin-1 [Teleopsis dalmanni]|uniref:snurportin-1 n=1 Tax=Teleopsis dalmanni TaxID=139649 RepID=UPI0018CF5A7C|nr:snurportin-1 [Teleopsis dalmanni]
MHSDLYKKSLRNEDLQEERRNKQLQEQKRLRTALQDEHRQISNVDIAEEIELPKRYFDSRRNKEFTKIRPMDSEWLWQRPSDLQNWLIMPYPKGQRCILIAEGACTRIYTKRGKLCCILHTRFPGDLMKPGSGTVVDCVYSRADNTIYVIDMLAFGTNDLVNCEAQFRFFWLKSRFQDYEIDLDNDKGGKKIVLLDKYDFAYIDSVEETVKRFPYWPDNKPKLDGFVFYHKESSYVFERTPLMCWLFPYMITDVLGIPSSIRYKKPTDYIGATQYMHFLNENEMKKIKRNNEKLKSEPMDASLLIEMSETSDIEVDSSVELVPNDICTTGGMELDSLEEMLAAERSLELEGK